MASTTRPGDRESVGAGRRAVPERIPSRSVFAELGDESGTRGGGIAAVVVALVGGAAVAVGPVLGAVRSDSEGDWASGALAAVGWAAVFSLLPAALALVALLIRRVAVSGALLAGSGVVALGAAVSDAQLWTDAVDANRLELFRPETAVELGPGPGAYAVLAGHLLMVFGGVLGLFAVHRASLVDGYGSARSSEQVGRATGARIGFLLSALVVLAGMVFGTALFAPALESENPMILVPAVVDSDVTASAGAGIAAVAVLLVVASALASIAPAVSAAAIVGSALAALALVGTRLVASLSVDDRIEPGAGSVLGTAAAVVLVIAGLAVVPVDRIRDRRILRTLAVSTDAEAAATSKKGAVAPSAKGVAKAAMRAEAAAAAQRRTRWHVATGTLGVVVGILTGLGSLLPTLDVDATDSVDSTPQIYATRLVLVAGVVLVLASVWLWFSEFAAALRPVVGVVWVAAPFAVTGVTASVVTAADVPGVSIGIGVVVMWVAAAGAVVVGFFTGLAGSAEREEIDVSDDRSANITLLLVGGLGVAAFVVGLGLPLYRGVDVRGDEYVATTLADFGRGLEWWGPAMLAVAAIVALIVASRSRPARAAALLLGSAALAVVYVLALPLTSSRVQEAQPGAGVIAIALGIVLIGAAAILTSRTKYR
ncbi:hypothetical protein [Rhodococcus sp. NPDC058521]|uniref:hypothetical protein n=1 Tax=Rhodococcus sp. NPDC058521 TaxID=3346536 RepID=UPI003649177E